MRNWQAQYKINADSSDEGKYQPLDHFILREVLARRRRRARLWTKSRVGQERLVACTERAVSKRQNP